MRRIRIRFMVVRITQSRPAAGNRYPRFSLGLLCNRLHFPHLYTSELFGGAPVKYFPLPHKIARLVLGDALQEWIWRKWSEEAYLAWTYFWTALGRPDCKGQVRTLRATMSQRLITRNIASRSENSDRRNFSF